MNVDEIYITLERNNPLKIRIYEIQAGEVFWRYAKTVHIKISSLPEWQEYVKNTSLQIFPKIENIFKTPYKLINLIKLDEPAPRKKSG